MANSYLSSSIPLNSPYITFPDLLKRRANETPNKAAYIFIDEEKKKTVLTFQDLYTKAVSFAKALVSFGFQKGDTIGLSGRNVPEWLIANFGIQMAGGCVLCLPFCYKSSDLVRLLNSLAPVKALIIDPGLDDDNLETAIKITNHAYPDGKTSSDDVPTLEHLILFNRSKKSSIKCTVDDLCTKEFEVDFPRLDPEDLGLILLTSGSTGISKAIPHSHHVLVIMCWLFVGISESNNDSDIFYSDRAFFWGGGYPQFEMGCGATRVTLCNSLQFPSAFDATETVSEVIMNEKATLAYMVPSMLEIILKRKMPLRINKIITGSSPVFSSLLECIGEICDELQVVYGMTEIAAIASMTFNADNKTGLNGLLSLRPLPGVEMKVTDDERFLQPVGKRGNIYIRTVKIFNGYLNHKCQPSLEDYLLKSGWMFSEDGGYVTDENTIVVEGRFKDVIEVLGRKIFPYEIEDVIKCNTSVLDVIVIPVKEKESGDRLPGAAIIYKKGCEETKESMQNFIRKEFNITRESRMSEMMYVPQIIHIFQEFPLMNNGKPDRRGIKQLMQESIDETKYECVF